MKTLTKIVNELGFKDILHMQQQCSTRAGFLKDHELLDYWSDVFYKISSGLGALVISIEDVQSVILDAAPDFPFALNHLSEIVDELKHQGRLLGVVDHKETVSLTRSVLTFFGVLKPRMRVHARKPINHIDSLILPARSISSLASELLRMINDLDADEEGLLFNNYTAGRGCLITKWYLKRYIASKYPNIRAEHLEFATSETGKYLVSKHQVCKVTAEANGSEIVAWRIELDGGIGSKAEADVQDRAALLEWQFERQVDVKIEKFRALADACQQRAKELAVKKQKDSALMELKRRDIYLKQIQNLDVYRFNVLESMLRRDSTFAISKLTEALEASNSAQKDVMDREKVQSVIEDAQDLQDTTADLNLMFEAASNSAVGLTFDEVKELEKLAAEVAQDVLDTAPEVPRGSPADRNVQISPSDVAVKRKQNSVNTTSKIPRLFEAA